MKDKEIKNVKLIFAIHSSVTFEDSINQWLNENSDKEIIDIKYSADEYENCFSALIIYKVKNSSQ